MCEILHGRVADTQNGTVSDVVSQKGIDLRKYFECFRDGEGYSSPFEMRLSLETDIDFGEIEVVVVLFVPGLYIEGGFADILGVCEGVYGDAGSYIFWLHLNDNIIGINT